MKSKVKSGKTSDSSYKDSKGNPLRTIWASPFRKKTRVRYNLFMNRVKFLCIVEFSFNFLITSTIFFSLIGITSILIREMLFYVGFH